MKKSILPLTAIALASSLLVACNDEEELVPKMDSAKPAVQAPAPKAEEPKADEPELVPIQSLSGNTEGKSNDNAKNENAAQATTGKEQTSDKGDFVAQDSIQS